MCECGLPGAMAGVPALRMSVSPCAPRSEFTSSGGAHAMSRAVVTPKRGQLLERVPVAQVDVGVDEPGQQHAALAVDDLGRHPRAQN